MIRKYLPRIRNSIRHLTIVSFLEIVIMLIGLGIGYFAYWQATNLQNFMVKMRNFEQQTRALVFAVEKANIAFNDIMQGNSNLNITQDVFGELIKAGTLCKAIDEESSEGQIGAHPSSQSICSQVETIQNLTEQRWQDHLLGSIDSKRAEYNKVHIELFETLNGFNETTDPRMQENDRKTTTVIMFISVGISVIFVGIALFVQITRISLLKKANQLQDEVEKRSELNRNLDNERNFLNTLLDNLPDAVYAKDLDDKFMIANKTAVQGMGLERKETIIGKSETEFLGEEYSKIAHEENQQIFTTGKPVTNKQVLVTDHRTGKTAWMQSTKVPFHNSEGKIIGLVGIGQDVTEQKEFEEKLKETNERLTLGIAELERTNAEAERISEMVDLLQACPDVEQACLVIADQMRKFFPKDSGYLYLYHPSRNILDRAVEWGEPTQDPLVIKPDDCWGLRRGRMHIDSKERNSSSANVVEHSLICPHVVPEDKTDYLCVPLIAQGEALGLLHLRHKISKTHLSSDKNAEWYDLSKQRRIQSIIDSVALALANLKLRTSLREQTIRDPLTGMFNRRYMVETLEREILRAKRNNQSIGVIMVDVDHFKRFNDTFGHQAGDDLLKEIGHFLMSHVRGEDIACRYGGEEFFLVMPGAELEPTRKRAQDLCEKIRYINVSHQGQTLGSVTISAGVAVYPEYGVSSESLIHQADQALYRAKAEGRDRVMIAQTE